MKYLNILSLIIFIIGLSFACTEENCCENINITSLTKDMEYLGCSDATTNMKIQANEPYLVITNQADYDSLVTGSCHPTIDFSQFQLIIGYYGSQKDVTSFSYEYYKSCESNFFKLVLIPNYLSDEDNIESKLFYYQLLVPNDEKIDYLRVTIRNSSL